MNRENDRKKRENHFSSCFRTIYDDEKSMSSFGGELIYIPLYTHF
jgi:hypothetical protein